MLDRFVNKIVVHSFCGQEVAIESFAAGISSAQEWVLSLSFCFAALGGLSSQISVVVGHYRQSPTLSGSMGISAASRSYTFRAPIPVVDVTRKTVVISGTG